MKTKLIVIPMMLFCFIFFGMPENKGTPYGTGIARAQDAEAHALRLVRDLEEALKSGDQKRIRLAHQRVNAHQQAAFILTQRPLLQRQLQTATQTASIQELKTQAVVPAASRKETLTKQAQSLDGPAGLASASGFQGMASGMEQVSRPVSSQIQGVSREGIKSPGGRVEGVSSSMAAGTGSAGIQEFSARQEGISREIGSGVSSAVDTGTGSSRIQGFSARQEGIAREIGSGVSSEGARSISGVREGISRETGAGISSSGARGIASETARGFSSQEQGNREKDVSTAAAAAAVLTASSAQSSSGRSSAPQASTTVRRTPAAVVAPSPAFAAPASAAASSTVTPDVISRTPSGFKPPSAASQQVPALDRAIPSSRSPEAPRSMASAEIIGRGPGGTGVIVPPGVKEGANTVAGQLVPGPARPSTSGSGGSPFYTQEGSPDAIKVKPPTTGGNTGGSTSQEMLNIHNLAQQLRPTPPDPQQVKQWADSIRRPGSSEPPKQIEKFSGGDPSWAEINRRVTAASEPLYSKDRTIPVRDPDMARLANPGGKFVQADEHTGLAQMAGRTATQAAPRSMASAEIIGRGPGGAGIIAPPGVKEGANTVAGPPVPGPARPPTMTERMDAYSQAQQQAAQRREGLVDALRSGNQEQINRAALQVRQDPLAVKQANISELPEMRTRMNEPMANIQRSMEPGIKNEIARQYGVKPNEVEVVYTSNPAKGPKVHQDADVTVRVRGMDVPADKARPIVNEQFQRAAGGDRVAPGVSPDKLAERSYIETTDRLHRHAFGSSAAEGEQIIKGSKSQPIRDVRQVTGAMEDKFNVARNQAAELTRQGRLPEAEVQRGLAMDQTVKSFDGQAASMAVEPLMARGAEEADIFGTTNSH